MNIKLEVHSIKWYYKHGSRNEKDIFYSFLCLKNMHIEMVKRRKKKVVILSDRINFDDSIKLSKTIEALTSSKYKEIIIDLHKVDYMDSCLIGALIHSQIMLKRYNKKIILASPQHYVKKIIQNISLGNVFEIVESYDSKIKKSHN